ncbi:hypothetical protein [Nodosilinea nodulosa]|uniref:hypothetical protein n=1 Tax=Nodosilinea nodulosa TaxID=416001 RepID=UPI0002DCC663|nr:hypothetical protein [Nodosilinea nodulosa]
MPSETGLAVKVVKRQSTDSAIAAKSSAELSSNRAGQPYRSYPTYRNPPRCMPFLHESMGKSICMTDF